MAESAHAFSDHFYTKLVGKHLSLLGCNWKRLLPVAVNVDGRLPSSTTIGTRACAAMLQIDMLLQPQRLAEIGHLPGLEALQRLARATLL